MPVFEFTEAALHRASTDDLLGMWESTAEDLFRGPGILGTGMPGTEGAAAVSYGLPPGGVPPSDETVWRVRLSADLHRATARLAEGQARQQASQRALPRAQRRIARFAERAHRASAQGAGLSFAAGDTNPVTALHSLRSEADPAEAVLIDMLVGIEGGEQEMGMGAGVSFGLGEALGEGVEWLKEQVQAFARRLLETLTTYVRVETEVGGVVLAQTSVGWGGDVRTIWRQAAPAEQMQVHHHTLTLALRSQDTLLQTIVVAAQGAIKLSVALSTGGVLLALPAAWTFINTLLLQERESSAG